MYNVRIVWDDHTQMQDVLLNPKDDDTKPRFYTSKPTRTQYTQELLFQPFMTVTDDYIRYEDKFCKLFIRPQHLIALSITRENDAKLPV